MKALLPALLLGAVCLVGALAAVAVESQKGGRKPPPVRWCEPYAETCRACKNCRYCLHCRVKRGWCSVCWKK